MQKGSTSQHWWCIEISLPGSAPDAKKVLTLPPPRLRSLNGVQRMVGCSQPWRFHSILTPRLSLCPFRALLHTCVCALLRSCALIKMLHVFVPFCIQPRVWPRRLEISEMGDQKMWQPGPGGLWSKPAGLNDPLRLRLQSRSIRPLTIASSTAFLRLRTPPCV